MLFPGPVKGLERCMCRVCTVQEGGREAYIPPGKEGGYHGGYSPCTMVGIARVPWWVSDTLSSSGGYPTPLALQVGIPPVTALRWVSRLLLLSDKTDEK